MKTVLWKLIHQWRDATTTEAAWIARDQIDIELDKIEAAATQEPIATVVLTAGGFWREAHKSELGVPGVAFPVFLAAGAAPALLTASEKTQMWRDATIALCSHENCYLRGIADAERYYLAAGAAPYKDSTPDVTIGESSFESWYEAFNLEKKGLKQIARDSYAAGMGDPLVIAAGAAPAKERL